MNGNVATSSTGFIPESFFYPSLKDGRDDDDDDFFPRALWTRVYDADAGDATRGFPRGSRRWRLEGDGGDQAKFGEQPGR